MAAEHSYDPASLAPRDRYKMLISLVIPRPIALVTTIGPTGVVNAAPFSFFNVFSDEPPLCVLGLQARTDGSLKDTSAHIRDRGAFPERAALNQLSGLFLTQFYAMVARWVVWAENIVKDWPDDVREAPFDTRVAEEGVELAESIAVILEQGEPRPR